VEEKKGFGIRASGFRIQESGKKSQQPAADSRQQPLRGRLECEEVLCVEGYVRKGTGDRPLRGSLVYLVYLVYLVCFVYFVGEEGLAATQP
jgi:hypothetical protein